jgi:hypothetical protein
MVVDWWIVKIIISPNSKDIVKRRTRIKMYEKKCKTFPINVTGYSLGPWPHEFKLFLPSRSIAISLLTNLGC